jgi:hypothetical protein
VPSQTKLQGGIQMNGVLRGGGLGWRKNLGWSLSTSAALSHWRRQREKQRRRRWHRYHY